MKKIIIFSFGVLVGIIAVFVGLIAIFAIVAPRDAKVILNRPYKFADIKICHLKNTDGDSLILAKDKKIFFYAETEANKPDEVTNIAIIDQNDVVRFKMTASKEGKWKNAVYLCDQPSGYTIGEAYTDINFDGQFDIKDVYDDAGKRIDIFIYIKKDWKKVDGANAKEAASRQVKYIFDTNYGWVKK